jgi:hypothetical protein
MDWRTSRPAAVVKREDAERDRDELDAVQSRARSPIFAVSRLRRGRGVCFAVNGLSFLAVIVALLLIHTACGPRRSGGMLDEMKDGFARRAAESS